MKRAFVVPVVLAALVLSLATLACKKPSSGGPQALTWQSSADQKTWAAITLPSTDFKCTDCDRFFKATVKGKPSSVKFRFASDNKARLSVNGKPVFEDAWKEGWCSESPCCSDCCDNPANCKSVLSKAKQHELPAAALSAFHDGDNDVVWQVHQESGGSGFDVQMDVN